MDHHNDKVGSSPDQAGHMVGKKDFGAHEDDVPERNYVSEETRHEDPGSGTKRSGTGPRVSGVGGNDSGRGSSSGGDVDADDQALIGFGDENLRRPDQKQTAAAPGKRPTLNPPVVQPGPGNAAAGQSASADDANNETRQTGNAYKGDVTADEATGSGG